MVLEQGSGVLFLTTCGGWGVCTCTGEPGTGRS